MNAYWLTYKPRSKASKSGLPAIKLRRLVKYFENHPNSTAVWWRCVSYKSAKINERVYFFRQGQGRRGIFGIGHVLDKSERKIAAYDPIFTSRVKVKIEHIADPDKYLLMNCNEICDIVGENLINARASGNIVGEHINYILEKELLKICSDDKLQAGSSKESEPDEKYDERKLALRNVNVRIGQVLFRSILLKAYDGRCAISGCTVNEVLEAAHIFPYTGPATNNVQNGLLLRSDIHKLFDAHLIAIDPKTIKILVSGRLDNTQYKNLDGRKLRPTENISDRPSRKSLELSYEKFYKL